MTLKNINADVFIENIQRTGEETEKFFQHSPASFYEKNGKYYLFYEEGEQTLAKGVSSLVKTDGERVTIKRTGPYQSVMVYEKGKESRLLYTMPYGAMEMKLTTQHVQVALGAQGGEITLVYTLDMEGRQNQNHISIQIKTR